MKRLPRYKLCFVCGRENGAGLNLQFYRDGPRVYCDWVPDEKHLGYRDRLHGGVVAAALDEAMAWAPALELGRLCFSIELCVKYRKPIPSGVQVVVEGTLVENRRRVARTEGRVLGSDGGILAEATGLYYPLRPGETEAILPHLYIEDDGRPVTLADL
jgi:uncharacterized protein (TIGR00369 family)